MKKMTCEMCGSTELIKQDGLFVCQSCGCKYSVEEARKLLIEIDGPVEVSGTVKVDQSASVDSYLTMAQAALTAQNHKEAETYSNKIIEIDPANYRAWVIKGKAAGWQTTGMNSRLSEAVSAFSTALGYCPEMEKESIRDEIRHEFNSLAIAVLSLHGGHFAKFPSESNRDAIYRAIIEISNAVSMLSRQCGVSYSPEELTAPMADVINGSAATAYREIVGPEYRGNPNDSNDRPNKFRFDRFIDRGALCTDLISKAIEVRGEDDEGCEQYYENLIFINKEAIDSCSWKIQYVNGTKKWYKEYVLVDNAKAVRKDFIAQCEEKKKQIAKAREDRLKQEKQERIDAYWAGHAEEKAALEEEKKRLEMQISELEEEAKQAPAEEKVKNLFVIIDDLSAKKNALGMFKAKEKKALQEQIDALMTEVKGVKEEMSKARNALLDEKGLLQRRARDIENDLTRDRG